MSDLVQAWYDLCFDRDRTTNIENPPDLLALCLVDGDDHLANSQLVDQASHITGRTENLYSAKTATSFSLIVIYKSAYLEFPVGAAHHFLCQVCTHSSGPDDKSRFSFDPPTRAPRLVFFPKFIDRSTDHAKAEHASEGQHGIDQN